MNRFERRRAAREARRDRGQRVVSPDESVFRHVFGAEGAEELTDQLIAELVGLGWPEADLRAAATLGARYSRPRHSLIFPPTAD